VESRGLDLTLVSEGSLQVALHRTQITADRSSGGGGGQE
jgi:hypothetical protein